MRLIKDYDCTINYNPRKVNVVVAPLSRKSSSTLACLTLEMAPFVQKLKKMNVGE